MSRELNATLAAALINRDLGFVPLRLIGKVPIDCGWSSSKPPRTCDLFKHFYSDPRRYNLGIRMGRPLVRGGLFPTTIDLDARSGGFRSWPSFLDGIDLPETAKAETGGCGRQWIMLSPVRFGCATGVFDLPGIDLIGAGGQVVIEPSVHPYTGKSYTWSIPPWHGLGVMPDRLVERMVNWFGLAQRRPHNVEHAAPLGTTTHRGNVGELTRQYIERFPIGGYGMRAGAFKSLIPSLVGLGYDDETIVAVAVAWWSHYYGTGLCRTSPRHAAKEAGLYVARLRASGRFRRATSTEAEHFTRCESIAIPAEAHELMRRERSWFTPKDAGPSRRDEEYNTSPTPIRGRLSDRLCERDEEFRFVEALLIHTHHRWSMDPSGPLTMTNNQVAQIIADRHGKKPDERQIDRLVKLYVDTPGHPAKLASLLRRTAVGHNAHNGHKAAPSEYDVLGLTKFMDLGVVA